MSLLTVPVMLLAWNSTCHATQQLAVFRAVRIFMVAICNRADHYIFALLFLSSIFFYSSPNLSGRRLDIYHTSFHTWCGLSANLECRSEMCCTRLAGNTGRKNDAKNRHLRTIAQLCRAISSQLRHASTIGKKLKQQYLPHMFLQ